MMGEHVLYGACWNRRKDLNEVGECGVDWSKDAVFGRRSKRFSPE